MFQVHQFVSSSDLTDSKSKAVRKKWLVVNFVFLYVISFGERMRHHAQQ